MKPKSDHYEIMSYSAMVVMLTVISTSTTVGHYNGDIGLSESSSRQMALQDSTTISMGVSPSIACVTGNLSVGAVPRSFAYDSAKGTVYSADDLDEYVSVINGSRDTLVSLIPAGPMPFALADDPVGNHLYVAQHDDPGNVTVFNTNTEKVSTTIENLGAEPAAVAFDQSSRELYVAGFGHGPVGYLTIINSNLNQVITTLPVGVHPGAIAIDSATGYVYIANIDSNNVSVVTEATNSLVGSIGVGGEPGGVAYDADNGNIYVTNYASGNVTVINGRTHLTSASIRVGTSPTAITYDWLNGLLYTSNFGSDNVSEIDGNTNTVVGSVNVGPKPLAIGIDGSNGKVYVSSDQTGIISIISPSVTCDGSVHQTSNQPFWIVVLPWVLVLAIAASISVVLVVVLRRRKSA